ncbi:MAG: hypothetical protein AB9869_03440 [Verrucomicrobiia bacterium]
MSPLIAAAVEEPGKRFALKPKYVANKRRQLAGQIAPALPAREVPDADRSVLARPRGVRSPP